MCSSDLRDIEGGIVQGSFRSLHPVDNAFSFWRRVSAAPDKNSGVSGDLAKCFRDFVVVCGLGGHLQGKCLLAFYRTRGPGAPYRALFLRGLGRHEF